MWCLITSVVALCIPVSHVTKKPTCATPELWLIARLNVKPTYLMVLVLHLFEW